MGTNSNRLSNQEPPSPGGPSPVQGGGGRTTVNPSNGTAEASTSAVAGASSATWEAMKHNPGLVLEWSAEEQAILVAGLSKYSSETPLFRYAKIASQLQGKSARDVALRCRWMSEKESTKRRKEDDTNPRKSKDKQERVTDPSAKASSHLGRRPPYLLMLPLDNDDEISYKDIDPPMRKLLENNDQIFKKVHVNLSNLQVQENIQLLCQARDNLDNIMIKAYAAPGLATQMPSFPAKINIELTNSILPRRINTNMK